MLHISSVSDRFATLTGAASAYVRGKVMLMGNFNASNSAKPDIDDDLGQSLEALRLPVARTDRRFGGHGRHLLQPCLLAGLLLGADRSAGDADAAISYPHAAGGPRPDHPYCMVTCFLMHFGSAVRHLIISPSSPLFAVSPLLIPAQPASPMMATLCPSSAAMTAMWNAWMQAARVHETACGLHTEEP